MMTKPLTPHTDHKKEMEINWLAFRAEVAKVMLPIIYREIGTNSRLVTNRESEAVTKAVEVAEMLEHELKR